jgi:hypothetical protein
MLSSNLRCARAFGIDSLMAKDAADKERIKSERLREALRANLRRRKGQSSKPAADQNESHKPDAA